MKTVGCKHMRQGAASQASTAFCALETQAALLLACETLLPTPERSSLPKITRFPPLYGAPSRLSKRYSMTDCQCVRGGCGMSRCQTSSTCKIICRTTFSTLNLAILVLDTHTSKTQGLRTEDLRCADGIFNGPSPAAQMLSQRARSQKARLASYQGSPLHVGKLTCSAMNGPAGGADWDSNSL